MARKTKTTGARAPRRTRARKQRLRLGSHLSVAGGVSHAVEAAMELDLYSLQIFTKNASRWQQKPTDPGEVERFQALRKEWGPHPVGSHDSYLINLASPDDELWEKSVEAFCDELRRAHILGLDYLITHPGAHVGSGVEAGVERVCKGLTRVLKTVDEGPTRVLLENTAGQGTTLGRAFEELAAMLTTINAPERLGVCLDSCHLFAAGHDLRTPRAYEATMRHLDDCIGSDHVYWWHLNDSKGGLGSHLDRHEHIGQGQLGHSAFRLLLRDPRFHGIPKVLETPKEDDMDRINIDLLWSL